MQDTEETTDQSQAQGTQPEAPAEQATAAANSPDATQDVSGQTDQQGKDQPAPEGQEDFIGESPKELESFKKDILNKYYAKTRELAKERQTITKYQKDAETLQQLMGYKPFQDWYNAQKNGGQPEPQTQLTEEQLEQLRTDPSKFSDFIAKAIERTVETKFGPQMKTVQERAEDLEVAKEFEAAKETYGEDFEIAHKSGDLDPFYDKELGFEAAYALYKLKNTGKPAPAAKPDASKTVDRSKQALSEKPSSGPGKLPQIRIVNPKGFDDAFDQAFAAALKGEKVKIGGK